jgi:hypothetical protein
MNNISLRRRVDWLEDEGFNVIFQFRTRQRLKKHHTSLDAREPAVGSSKIRFR